MRINECSLALRARFSLAIDHGLATVYRFERGFALVVVHGLATVYRFVRERCMPCSMKSSGQLGTEIAKGLPCVTLATDRGGGTIKAFVPPSLHTLHVGSTEVFPPRPQAL